MANYDVRYEVTVTDQKSPLQAALQMWMTDMRGGPNNPILTVLNKDGEQLDFDLYPFGEGPAGHLKQDVEELGAIAIEVEAVLDNEGEVVVVETKGGPWNAVALYFRLGPDFYGVCEARHIEDYRYDGNAEDTYILALEQAEMIGDCLNLPVVLKPSLKLAGLIA